MERLTRGSRDGFVETMMFNVALTRRRIRDPGLRVEASAWGVVPNDVALMYIEDITNPALVAEVRKKLEQIDEMVCHGKIGGRIYYPQ